MSLNHNRQFNDTTIHMKKGYKLKYIYKMNVISAIILQLCFYNLLLHSQKRKTTFESNLMPPPPWQLEKVNNYKYLTRWGCSKNYDFLFQITNLNFSTIIIPLVRTYYILSKTCIRWLSISHTTIFPSLRFAVDTGRLNSPLSLPSLPNFVTNFPLSSNT